MTALPSGVGARIHVPTDAWVQVYDVTARYAHLLDAWHFEELREIFTDDVTFDTDPHPTDAPPDYPFPANGCEAAIAGLREIRTRWRGIRSRHTISNVTVVAYEERRLRSIAVFATIHTAPGALPVLQSAGHYDDVMVLADDGFWRIASRTVHGDRGGAFHREADMLSRPAVSPPPGR